MKKISADLKQIKNISELEILNLFPLTPDPYINISLYVCCCIGKINNEKYAINFKIKKCKEELFAGPHEIEYLNETKIIPTFTHLRKNIFGFQDKMGIDRSTFLIFKNKYIRLNLIRNRLQIPNFNNVLVHPPLIFKISPFYLNVNTTKIDDVVDFITNNIKHIHKILSVKNPDSEYMLLNKLIDKIEGELKNTLDECLLDFLKNTDDLNNIL